MARTMTVFGPVPVRMKPLMTASSFFPTRSLVERFPTTPGVEEGSGVAVEEGVAVGVAVEPGEGVADGTGVTIGEGVAVGEGVGVGLGEIPAGGVVRRTSFDGRLVTPAVS